MCCDKQKYFYIFKYTYFFSISTTNEPCHVFIILIIQHSMVLLAGGLVGCVGSIGQLHLYTPLQVTELNLVDNDSMNPPKDETSEVPERPPKQHLPTPTISVDEISVLSESSIIDCGEPTDGDLTKLRAKRTPSKKSIFPGIELKVNGTSSTLLIIHWRSTVPRNSGRTHISNTIYTV